MASSDIPPPHAPPWLIAFHMSLLALGALLWDAAYILMTRRALVTRSYGMPLLPLALNLSWEIAYVFCVCEEVLETVGFSAWLVLDVGIVYTTLKFGEADWRGRRHAWVGRHIAGVLAGMVVVGCVANYAFIRWWLEVPGRGHGIKQGKWWGGREGFDTTELAFWSAAVIQVTISACSLVMLVERGHSGGTSFAIWFCRAVGSLCGIVLCNAVMWWYWPEAHGFVVSPLGVALWGTAVVCDLVYPFVLWRVRKTEMVAPDGRIIRTTDKTPANGSGRKRQ